MLWWSRKLKDQNIQRKLVSINLITILCALLPVVGITFSFEYFAVRSAIIQEIRVQVAIISDNVAPALAFGDSQAARESLATLSASPDIEFAILLKDDEDILASYYALEGAEGQSSRELPQVDGEQLSWKYFRVQQSVYLANSEPVGKIIIQAGMGTFFERITLYSFVIVLTAIVAFGLSFAIARQLGSYIIVPLKELMASVDRVSKHHDYSERPHVITRDEIGDISQAFGELMGTLQEREEKLQDLAFFDAVTSLPNRHYFTDYLAQSVKKSQQYGSPLALLYIDLDNFKTVNDTLGHDVGDALLKGVGRRLRSVLRSDDQVFRIGGDEFTVVLQKNGAHDVAEIVAGKIIASLDQAFEHRGVSIQTGASIGISLFPTHAENQAELLKNADRAMYKAKQKSGSAYHVFSFD